MASPVETSSELTSGRQLITNSMVSEMTRSYRIHFSVYSKGRKKVSQRLPKQVWEAVFKDVADLEGFRNVKEDSLKKQLKATLGDIATGDANDGANDQAVLQDDNVVEKLKELDSFASRNVLNLREDILSGFTKAKAEAGKRSSSDCSRSTPTKADAYAAVQSIADTMESMLADRARFADSFDAVQKRKLEMSEQNLELQQKRLKFESDSLQFRLEMERQRLDLDREKSKAEQLIQLHNAGILTKEELLQRMNNV